MSMRSLVESLKQTTTKPLVKRLNQEQLKELKELVDMYNAGELVEVPISKLTGILRKRWNQPRLQPATILRYFERSQDVPEGRNTKNKKTATARPDKSKRQANRTARKRASER